MDEDIEKCKEAIRLIKDQLPEYIVPSLRSLPSQIPHKVVCLRGLLIHRVSHLAEQAIELHNIGYFLPLMMTVRSAMETGALIYLLDKKLGGVISNNLTVDELEEFLERATIGSRNDDTEIDSINVLTALDHISKEYPPVRNFYDTLSEFCHPNFAGLLGSYACLSDDKSKMLLSPKPKPPLYFGVPPLIVTLLLSTEYFNRIREQDDELYRLCGCT